MESNKNVMHQVTFSTLKNSNSRLKLEVVIYVFQVIKLEELINLPPLYSKKMCECTYHFGREFLALRIFFPEKHGCRIQDKQITERAMYGIQSRKNNGENCLNSNHFCGPQRESMRLSPRS